MNVDVALERVFRLPGFRPGQREVIEAAIQGRDVLAVMPTGAGKSLTYQLPASIASGLTVVISPLIALMRDQVAALEKLGILAAALHSGLSETEQERVLLRASSLKMLYLAPERLRSRTTLERLKALRISRLVVDEAHCVSQWGHDFRPDYQLISEARAALGQPPVTAVTATATVAVQNDVILSLKLRDTFKLVTGFDRLNLAYRILEVPTETAKLEVLKTLLELLPRPGLVYAATRREAEDLARTLQSWGVRASFYHGAREVADRDAVQDAFQKGKLEVIVATNAFGMGVDKRDVRFVIHYRVPGTLEAYYQEAGRAGRDGDPSQCWLLFDQQDRALQAHFIEQSTPSELELKRIWSYFHAARDDEDVISLRWMDLERNLQIPSNKLRVAYQHLEKIGALERRLAPAGLFKAKVSTSVPSFEMSALEEHKRRKTVMLEQMLGFAMNTTCRRRGILEYFGETAAFDACGECDVCRPNPLPAWTRRVMVHLRDVKRGAWKAPNFAKIAKPALADWTLAEIETLLKTLQKDEMIDSDYFPTFKGKLALESKVVLPLLAAIATPAPNAFEQARSMISQGVSISDISVSLSESSDNIQKMLERALDRGELEPGKCISAKNLKRVRVAAENIGFSPLSKLVAALPDLSKLELKAARLLIEEQL
jgi:ATP-dependent DNA helicase RecQ